MKLYKIKDTKRGTVRDVRARSQQEALQQASADSGISIIHLVIFSEMMDDSHGHYGMHDNGHHITLDHSDHSSSTYDSSSSSSFDSGGGSSGGGGGGD